MRIYKPAEITPRSLPGVRIGNGWVSIAYSDRPGDDGRVRYRYYIDYGKEYTADDLQSGCGGGSLEEGLSCLVNLLSCAGEAYAYEVRTGWKSENTNLFDRDVAEWAYQHSDEISSLLCELDENQELIVE